MILKKLYNRYFQKSKSFLFPILGFKRKMSFPPRQTYVAWKNYYVPQDCRLMVSFDIGLDTPEWQKFLKDRLYTHEFFSEHIASTEHYVNTQGKPCKRAVDIIVFDLSFHSEDVHNFLKGKYSLLSDNLKTVIRNYYGYQSPEWAHMESFVFPEKHYPQYANLLDVEEELLREGVELCEQYNAEKETFTGDRDDNLENLPGNFVDLNNHLL